MNAIRVLCLLSISCPVAWCEDDAPTRPWIEPRLVHLRSGTDREWSDFPETADGPRLSVSFDAVKNTGEHALMLRQQDVKQQWFVSLNGKKLGELVRDENDMTIGLAVPANALKDGDNVLVIESPASAKTPSDDIHVGRIEWHRQPLQAVLSAATLDVAVVDRE